MTFEQLLHLVRHEPLFESSLLLAGGVYPGYVQQQLSRWCRDGRIISLRRGLYMLASPWRQVEPHPFLVSNRLERGSYVSLMSALSMSGLVPDVPQEVCAVTPGRPSERNTPVGRFRFRHLHSKQIGGYRAMEIAPAQVAMVATPEKALLDHVHLTPQGDAPECLASLRLQGLDQLDVQAMMAQAWSPKTARAARWVADLAEREAAELIQL